MNDNEPETLDPFWSAMIAGTLLLAVVGCMVVFWWLT